MIHLTNKSGASVMLTERGAGIVSIVVPDRNGVMGDVVLGYRDEESYLADGPCAGKIPGRFANRIDGGCFTLDGKEYQLVKNNPGYQLHGGPDGFSNRLWKASRISDTEVILTLDSPDGDQGYPGNMHVEATYTWSDDNSLTLSIKATTDAPTIINLTNHTYWNLDGEDSGFILDHVLKLNASRWLATSEALIPTGELSPVEGTPMDFRTAKPIGRDIKADFPALKYGDRVPGIPRRTPSSGLPVLRPPARRDIFPDDNLQAECIKIIKAAENRQPLLLNLILNL